ncbi:DUF952 domain-containing protein [Neobacillus sp.]|uniref:DUF952 domain-containing protein n=1 Tax=Neobacillus sp. TaxID=2675273 RepID=UPI0028998012|nr:DUF952 domain-containing protein [Neobacillus sp.]
MILHIISLSDWEKALVDGQYCPVSLEKDSFIHCSTLEQVIGVANFLYKGKKELYLLCIEEQKVNSKIVFEDLYNSDKLFPHIYGPLNLDAVFKVVEFPPNSDGCFDLPCSIIEEYRGIVDFSKGR